MKHGRLSDLMLSVGVLDAPGWFDQISLPFWPMPHQMDMVKTYPRNMRYLDAGEPGCVSADTEFLTPTGWKRIDQYVEGDQVAQFHPDSGQREFVTPDAYIKKPCYWMINWTSQHTDQMLSVDHRVLLYGKDGVPFVVNAWQIIDPVGRIKDSSIHVGEGYLADAFPPDSKLSIEPTQDGFMYCFQVPTTLLLLRRNGKVFATGNCGKTFPAQIHAVLMAALGNKVVFSMPPKLILQFYREFGTFFEGIHSKLKIAHMDVDAGGKKKLLADWEANGWPDILIISYGTFRLLNDIHKGKAIGQNLWKLRKLNSLGASDEFAAPYFDAEGVAVAPKAQPYTKDGRRIGKDGKAPNPYQLLLKRRGYHVMFFDEAHALCGMDSILSKSISDISEELGEEVAIYLMTGTPIPTHLHDVYGIMRLVNPGAYMGKASFLRQHCITKEFRIPIPGKNTQKTISSIVDYIDTDRIYDNLWKNASRVQKRDVMKMPDPVISEVPVKLTGAHRKLYKEVIKNRFAILGENVLAPDNVMQLRHMALQLISCPEHYGFSGENEVAKAAGDLVESIAPCPTRKLIIFAYYKSAMEGLTKQFAHYAPCVVFGETSDAQGQIDAFVNDPARCVLIINWIAGGAGLNLQVASHILFYECPTSPKDAKQAIARADRKGQLKTVNVYFLRVLDTLSDKNFKSLLKNEESNNRGIKDKHDLLHELMIA